MVRTSVISLALSLLVTIAGGKPHVRRFIHQHHIYQRDIHDFQHTGYSAPDVGPAQGSNPNEPAPMLDVKSQDVNFQDVKPPDVECSDVESPDVKPLNVQPLDVKPLDIQPLNIKPLDVKPLDVKASSYQESGTGVDLDFPDGEINCTEFPSNYGAMKLAWVTKDGWSGIQADNTNEDYIGICKNGSLCSYACPPGYSKAQWPDNQPTNGESHGGLMCTNGKLYKTRKEYPKLCQKGVGSATIVNNLDKFAAICRTDYPGSENMVVPLACTPGSTQTLTVPSADTSYVWEGKSSSAQYYVNKAGVSLKEGCVWGQPNGGKGNWSPVVIGAGYSDNTTWLSISQNSLNSEPLDYNIKIVAAEGGKISGECRYENGKIYGQSSGDGCTVAVVSGSAQYVLY